MYSTDNIVLLVFLALEFFRIENYVESTESVEYNVYQLSFSNFTRNSILQNSTESVEN